MKRECGHNNSFAHAGAASSAASTAAAIFSITVIAGAALLAGCDDHMADQPRYEALEVSEFYPDLRASRHPVEGTVARGELEYDRYTLDYLRATDGLDANGYPFAITREILNRGAERYNIYCIVCHGALGDGDGIVPSRGYTTPPSYHIDRLRAAPPSHFVAAIESGFGRMPDYAEKVRPHDRWAIAAYIKALQLSQSARLDELPESDRRRVIDSEGGEGG